MKPRRRAATFAVAVACATGTACAAAPAAPAFNLLDPICGAAGYISGIAGKACGLVEHAGRLITAGKKLLGGHIGAAVKAALGEGGGKVAKAAATALGLAAVGTWVFGGARFVLHQTAAVLGQSTAPQLDTTWFSRSYWRVAAIATLLTLPFLCAAAIQALIRSDLSLLVRSALGYLPLAMLAVAIASPLTMLLLSASDQMSAVVSSAAGDAGAHLLGRASLYTGLLTLATHSPFVAVVVGLFMVGAAVVLWIELLMRAAAVYVIVLMLPLVFAALVWSARRVWAIRAIEMLIALILSKFVIVAVLSLGGAAAADSYLQHSVTGWIAGLVLLIMGAFAPWALLRLLPLGEVAASAASTLRHQTRTAVPSTELALSAAGSAHDWAAATTASMRSEVEPGPPAFAGAPASPPGHARGEERPGEAAVGDDRDGEETDQTEGLGGAPAAAPAAAVVPSGNGASRASDPGEDPAPPGERSPGLGRIWRMDDFSWPTIRLGPTEGGPDQPDSGPDGAEDHDPTPPPQEPDGGLL